MAKKKKAKKRSVVPVEERQHGYIGGSGAGVASANSFHIKEQMKSNYQIKQEIWMKKGLTKAQAYQMIRYGRLTK